ncbi:MAG TPA: regulatory signaling modulator protein AmpE [Lysobacter sp.]|nr:regulatory signaling modulator protein AmpE [Lysobacter sp.]
MAITLIATVVALVLGHVAPAVINAMRHYGWFESLLRGYNARFPEGSFWHGRAGLLLALLPPLLLVLLFQLALDEPMLGIPALLFGTLVLIYCWGPRDLDLDVDTIVQAPDAAARRQAAAALYAEGSEPSLEPTRLVEAVFRNALRRWFGVLFWFMVLGPFGALLYRLTALAVDGPGARVLPPGTLAGAQALLKVLDWPVAQLLTLALALVGNFDVVLEAWRNGGGAAFDLDAPFLETVARASVKSDLADEAADYADVDGMPVPALGELPELRDAMSLVWRSLLAWLAVLALFVIAGFVS